MASSFRFSIHVASAAGNISSAAAPAAPAFGARRFNAADEFWSVEAPVEAPVEAFVEVPVEAPFEAPVEAFVEAPMGEIHGEADDDENYYK
jgi:hypothetical protein